MSPQNLISLPQKPAYEDPVHLYDDLLNSVVSKILLGIGYHWLETNERTNRRTERRLSGHGANDLVREVTVRRRSRHSTSQKQIYICIRPKQERIGKYGGRRRWESNKLKMFRHIRSVEKSSYKSLKNKTWITARNDVGQGKTVKWEAV